MVLSIAALVGVLILLLAAPVSAASPEIHHKVLINECTSEHVQVKYQIIKDKGVSGITRLTIDATAQKRVGSKWKVATNNFSPVSHAIPAGAAKQTLTWSFSVTTPLYYKYRIVTVLRAWAGSTVEWTASHTSVTCGPTN